MVSSFHCKYLSLIPDDIVHLAAPAVAGLAAYFMSLDQYRARLLVPGSVARNVRDLIKSLAYSRLFIQPAVVWNGIDSRQFHCPVRRDAGSAGCPVRNSTLPIIPPATPSPSIATGTSTTSVTSSSSPPTSSTATATSTTTVTSSSSSSSYTTATDSSTTSSEGEVVTITMTISADDGSMETETITETMVGGVATNAPRALAGTV